MLGRFLSFSPRPKWRGFTQKLKFPALGGLILILILVLNSKETLQEFQLSVHGGIRSLLIPLENGVASIQGYFFLRSENERLQGENETLKRTLQDLSAYSQTLKTQYDFLKVTPPEKQAESLPRVRLLKGAPIGQEVPPLLLPLGEAEGIQVNTIVEGPLGLLGRVHKRGLHKSTIMHLWDPQSRVPVYIKDQSLEAILAGDGSRSLQLQYIPDVQSLRVGMPVYTSGVDGIYPPHRFLGTIEKIQGTEVYLTSPIDPYHLYYGYLIVPKGSHE